VLVTATIAGGGALQIWSNVRGFMVLSPSNGSVFSINGGGAYGLNTETYQFEPVVDPEMGTQHYPSIGFTPGPNAPLQVILDVYDGGIGYSLIPAAQFNQEGDSAGTATTGPSAGVTGSPILYRGPTGKLIFPNATASGDATASVVNVVAVQGSGSLGSGPVLTEALGANNITRVTAATNGANQNVTPPTGTGFCQGFQVVNQGTVVADFVSVAQSAADLTANNLLAIVPFQQTSAFIPYAFTNGTGTIFVNGVAAFNVTVVAYWR
jgi:hypothetical protein